MISYHKIACFPALIGLILVCLVKSFTQTSTTWYHSDQTPIPSAMSGGFLAPQFSSFDLDQDGKQELISFDRFSGIIQVWKPDTLAGGTFLLDNHTQVEWPVVESWLLVRDFNQDGISDLFTQGLHGIAVYRGSREKDIILFEKMTGESFIDDSLLFQSKSGNKTNMYHAASDIPIIEDIDMDGDLDIMSFELSGSYLYLYENQWDKSGKELDFVLSQKCWGYFVENQLSEDIKLSNSTLACPPPFSVRHAGSASCFVDVNLDSLPDLLLGDMGANTLQVLYNNGTATEGFIEKVDPVFPGAQSPAFLHYFPAAYKVNINQDSIPDVLVAVNDYPKTDFEGLWAYSGTQDSAQAFQLLSDHWLSGEYIDPGQYSSPYFININGDERPDVLISYQVTEGPAGPQNKIAYFEALSEHEYQLRDLDYGNLSEKLTSGYRPYLTTGDVDGDGDLDLLAGMSNGGSYLVQNSSRSIHEFEVASVIGSWAGLTMIHGATPELYDIDQDGDLDVLAGNDAGTINLYRNIGDSETPVFNFDLDHFPNIKRVGQISTVAQNSLLGRSAPRIIEYGTDTVLVSGSGKGHVYSYKLNTGNLESEFMQVDLEDWPQWTGGNARLTFDTSTDGFVRMLSGNMAGGITEHAVPAISTNTSLSYNRNLKIFPNPVNSGQAINLTSNHRKPVQKINIVRSNGTLVKSLQVVSEVVQGNMFPWRKILTIGWSPGIYFVEIIFQDKSRVVHKLIVQ